MTDAPDEPTVADLPDVGSVWTGPGGRTITPPRAPQIRPPITVADAWLDDDLGALVALNDPLHTRERIVPWSYFMECFRPADESPTTDDLLRQYAAQLRTLADEIDAGLAQQEDTP